MLSTRNTDEPGGWLRLLGSLTDDELARYGEIAADQRRLEWQYGWAQMLCLAGALGAIAWFMRESMMVGLTWRGAGYVGIATALSYWPYRKWIVRRLWRRHCKAVAQEAAERRQRQGR